MVREIAGVEGPLIPLSKPQINILRHLGKGLSKEQTVNELHLSDRKFRLELKEVFNILEIDGEVPAVMQALKLGILDVDVDGLLDPDFDLNAFAKLKRNEKIVMDLLVDSKSITLDKRDLEEADIKTSREPSEYVASILHKIVDERVGPSSRIKLLVHYYAFLNKAKEELPLRQTGEAKRGGDNLVLTPREKKVLQLLGLKRTHRFIAINLGVEVGAVPIYLSNACSKLGASSVEEAIEKATAMGMVKS